MHTLVRNLEHVVLGNFLTNSIFLIEGWSHVFLSVIITKKRNLSCGICSQAGYLGIGFKILPGSWNLPPGSHQFSNPCASCVSSDSVMGGLRELGRPHWNLFSAYCLRKTARRWACADLRKQKENNSWFQNLTFFIFPPDMSCVLYLPHFLAWLSQAFSSSRFRNYTWHFLPVWLREAKSKGSVIGRERNVGFGDDQIKVPVQPPVLSHHGISFMSPPSELNALQLWNGNNH